MAEGSTEFSADALMGQIQRLARLDTTVFDEVRDAQSQTIPAVVVVVVAIVLSALGGWLWLAIEFDGLDTGRVLLRELVLGSVFALALWAVWVLVTQVVLLNMFNVEADRMALLRCMGFAAAPAALMLLILIPSLSFGIGLIALMAWFVLTNYAVQAAAPNAGANQVVMANMAGFAVFAIVLSILADTAGMAPGVFVHGAEISEYVNFGSFSFG